MQQLETIKGKSIIVPRFVKRYILMFYHLSMGWQTERTVYTSPESAIQDFIERINKYPDENVKYYRAVEVELEVPFIPKEQ